MAGQSRSRVTASERRSERGRRRLRTVGAYQLRGQSVHRAPPARRGDGETSPRSRTSRARRSTASRRAWRIGACSRSSSRTRSGTGRSASTRRGTPSGPSSSANGTGPSSTSKPSRTSRLARRPKEDIWTVRGRNRVDDRTADILSQAEGRIVFGTRLPELVTDSIERAIAERGRPVSRYSSSVERKRFMTASPTSKTSSWNVRHHTDRTTSGRDESLSSTTIASS